MYLSSNYIYRVSQKKLSTFEIAKLSKIHFKSNCRVRFCEDATIQNSEIEISPGTNNGFALQWLNCWKIFSLVKLSGHVTYCVVDRNFGLTQIYYFVGVPSKYSEWQKSFNFSSWDVVALKVKSELEVLVIVQPAFN